MQSPGCDEHPSNFPERCLLIGHPADKSDVERTHWKMACERAFWEASYRKRFSAREFEITLHFIPVKNILNLAEPWMSDLSKFKPSNLLPDSGIAVIVLGMFRSSWRENLSAFTYDT